MPREVSKPAKIISFEVSISQVSNVVLLPGRVGQITIWQEENVRKLRLNKTLVGRWEAQTDKGPAVATYQLISGGTVLLERAEMGADHEMITAYYVDGNRLLLTHYCMAGNQPRMQAGSFDPKTNQIDFQFLDATNLPDPKAGHMHNAVFTFVGPSEVTQNWTFYKDGKPGFTVPLDYHRVD